MQIVARVVGSGIEVGWEDGRFFLAGEAVPAAKILEYDALGVLEWPSEDVRAWAKGHPLSEVPAEAPPATAVPDSRRGETRRVLEMLLTLGTFAALAIWAPSPKLKLLTAGVGGVYCIAYLLASNLPHGPGSEQKRAAVRVLTAFVSLLSLALLVPPFVRAGYDAAPAQPPPVEKRASQESSATTQTAAQTTGTSHRGERLYAVIVDSLETRAQAEQQLAQLRKAAAGIGAPWTIETSDHFTGMRPGWIVVLAATRGRANAQSVADRVNTRGFEAYVKEVTKNCEEPMTVYESGAGR